VSFDSSKKKIIFIVRFKPLEIMRILLSLPVIAFLICSCRSRQGDTPAADENALERIQAVCISTGTPLREEPRKEGKWISSMILGETLSYLGETVADSANPQQEYYRVELSDGTLAWARAYGILINAAPAAILAETPIYKRPDLVTKTEKSFRILEFVAIITEKDDWVEVVGAEKRKSGWILKSNLTTGAEDVAVATLAQKDLLDKEGNMIQENLAGFIESLPSANSQLARFLQDQMTTQVESAIEESIQEYEGMDEGEEIMVEDESEGI
jgi:hypothetical protein